MTVGVDASFAALAGAGAYGELALVELRPTTGVLRLTTWPMDVEVMGYTWKGVGALGKVGEMHESDDGAGEKLELELSPVPLDLRAFALSSPHEYRDRPARVWVALLDAHTLQINGAPVLRFAGVMDQMGIGAKDGGAAISMTCRTVSYDVRSNPSSLRMNHTQHVRRFAGERGFEYLQSLVGNPTVWAGKAFQAYMYIRNMLGYR
ncbi:hypothetical protein [Pseudacidovorax intermedius]|uniref:Uncharacterized protein n=1 Tax=Pseudacidovorax intermedius TaxID=433924 RepID=A0A147H082_9BURK|nr:hypothetical protein [Pseudacidovorax intermedius]KTT23236.1 hypothetical protein NS331_08450 [Pseudacidovorax intermedius]